MNIDKIKKGDRDDWDELVEEYADIINGKVFNIINDVETARDICQETFLRAFEQIGKFRGNTLSKFTSYLFTTARNLAINESKRRKKIKLISA